MTPKSSGQPATRPRLHDLMNNTQFCEECLEDIADKDVYWENDRAYCGRCGSELEMSGDEPDLLEVGSGTPLKPAADTDLNDGRDDVEVMAEAEPEGESSE